MDNLLNKSIFKTKEKIVEMIGVGHNEQEAVADAFEKIKTVSYELSKNMLVKMEIVDVVLKDYKKTEATFSKIKKNKEKIELTLDIKFNYSCVKFK